MGLRGFVWVDIGIFGQWRKECRHDVLEHTRLSIPAVAFAAHVASNSMLRE